LGDTEDLEALRSVLLPELLKPGHLELAGATPGSPEVDQDGTALVVAEGNLFTVDGREGEGGGLPSSTAQQTSHVERTPAASLGPQAVRDYPAAWSVNQDAFEPAHSTLRSAVQSQTLPPESSLRLSLHSYGPSRNFP
jgi:hypothetical protein